MVKSEVSIVNQIAAALLFVVAFLSVNCSPLADSIRVGLIFKYLVVPAYQWLVILCFMILWKYVSSEPWGRVVVKGAIAGLAMCLYLPMLDTLKQIWMGTPLSRIYVIYINIFVFTATSLLILLGAFAVRGAIDRIYVPLFFTSLYGVYFYYSNGYGQVALALLAGLGVSLWFATQKRTLTNMSIFAKSALSRLSDTRTLLTLVFVFALVLRLIFLLNLLSIEGPHYPIASDDGDTYDTYGIRGASDPMLFLRESPHFFWVFYSVFLSIVYKIFGHSYLAAGAAQSIMGASLCCLVFILAKRLTNNKVIASIASLGVAVDPRLIHLTVTINTEVLYIPFIITVVLGLFLYKDSAKDRSAIAFLVLAGLMLGLATILRTVGLGLAALALPWILIGGRDYVSGALMGRLRDCMLFTAAIIMMVAPITYTNYRNTHKFYLVYDTTGAVEWKVASVTWGEKLVPSNNRLIELGMVDPVNRPLDSFKAVCSRPIDFLKAYCEIIPKRLRNLYLWPGYGFFDSVSLLNSAKLPTRFAHHLEFYSILLMLVSFPVFIFSRIKGSLKFLTLIVVMYYTMLHGVLFLSIGPRYGAPMKPFLHIIAAFTVYKIFELARSKIR